MQCCTYLADTLSKLLSAPLLFNRNFFKLGSHARTALHRCGIDGIVSTFNGCANVLKNPQNSNIWPKSSPSSRTMPEDGWGRGGAAVGTGTWINSMSLIPFPSSSRSRILLSRKQGFTEVRGFPFIGPDRRVLNASSLSHIISTRRRASSFLFLTDFDRVSLLVFTT